MPIPTNLFGDLSRHLPDELITTLLNTANVRIERIVAHGHGSPEDDSMIGTLLGAP